jgi:hypothetical protein
VRGRRGRRRARAHARRQAPAAGAAITHTHRSAHTTVPKGFRRASRVRLSLPCRARPSRGRWASCSSSRSATSWRQRSWTSSPSGGRAHLTQRRSGAHARGRRVRCAALRCAERTERGGTNAHEHTHTQHTRVLGAAGV